MLPQVRKALFWFWDHWTIPLLLLVAIVGYFTFRKWRGNLGDAILKPVMDELRIIQAGSQTREMQIKLGAAAASAAVKEKYRVQTLALETEQAARVEELEDDPVSLAKYLERISR